MKTALYCMPTLTWSNESKESNQVGCKKVLRILENQGKVRQDLNNVIRTVLKYEPILDILEKVNIAVLWVEWRNTNSQERQMTQDVCGMKAKRMKENYMDQWFEKDAGDQRLELNWAYEDKGQQTKKTGIYSAKPS